MAPSAIVVYKFPAYLSATVESDENGQTDQDCPAKVALLTEGLDALAADILHAGLQSEGMS